MHVILSRKLTKSELDTLEPYGPFIDGDGHLVLAHRTTIRALRRRLNMPDMRHVKPPFIANSILCDSLLEEPIDVQPESFNLPNNDQCKILKASPIVKLEPFQPSFAKFDHDMQPAIEEPELPSGVEKTFAEKLQPSDVERRMHRKIVGYEMPPKHSISGWAFVLIYIIMGSGLYAMFDEDSVTRATLHDIIPCGLAFVIFTYHMTFSVWNRYLLLAFAKYFVVAFLAYHCQAYLRGLPWGEA